MLSFASASATKEQDHYSKPPFGYPKAGTEAPSSLQSNHHPTEEETASAFSSSNLFTSTIHQQQPLQQPWLVTVLSATLHPLLQATLAIRHRMASLARQIMVIVSYEPPTGAVALLMGLRLVHRLWRAAGSLLSNGDDDDDEPATTNGANGNNHHPGHGAHL